MRPQALVVKLIIPKKLGYHHSKKQWLLKSWIMARFYVNVTDLKVTAIKPGLGLLKLLATTRLCYSKNFLSESNHV